MVDKQGTDVSLELGAYAARYDKPERLHQPTDLACYVQRHAHELRACEAWLRASRRWLMTLRFNKGLAGAPAEAIEASRATAMNPQVLDAFALAIITMSGRSAYLAHPDLGDARDDATRMTVAVEELRRVAPRAAATFPSAITTSSIGSARHGADTGRS